ncbi:MAG: OmpA family protein [Cyanobacteria bacterium P01_G01_bin.54]
MATFSSLPDPWDESAEQPTPEEPLPEQSTSETPVLAREIADAPQLDTDLFRDVLVDINSVFQPQSPPPPPAPSESAAAPQETETADTANLTDRISKFEPLALEEPIDETLPLLDMPLADLQATFGIGQKSRDPKSRAPQRRDQPTHRQKRPTTELANEVSAAHDPVTSEPATPAPLHETLDHQETESLSQTQFADPDLETPNSPNLQPPTTLAPRSTEPSAAELTATETTEEDVADANTSRFLTVAPADTSPSESEPTDNNETVDHVDHPVTAESTSHSHVDTALNILKSLFQLGSQSAPHLPEEPHSSGVDTVEATGEQAAAELAAELTAETTTKPTTVSPETVPEPATELTLESIAPNPEQSSRLTPETQTPEIKPVIVEPAITAPEQGKAVREPEVSLQAPRPEPKFVPASVGLAADPAAEIPFPEEDDILTVLGSATSAVAAQPAIPDAEGGFATIGLVGEETITLDAAAPPGALNSDRPDTVAPARRETPTPEPLPSTNLNRQVRRSPLAERRRALEAQLEAELQAFWEVTQSATSEGAAETTAPETAQSLDPNPEAAPADLPPTLTSKTPTPEAIASPIPPTPSEQLNRPVRSTLNRLNQDFAHFFPTQTQTPEDPLADIRQYLLQTKEQPTPSAATPPSTEPPIAPRPDTAVAEPVPQTSELELAALAALQLGTADLESLNLESLNRETPHPPEASTLEPQAPAKTAAPTPATPLSPDPQSWDLDSLAAALSEPPSARLTAKTIEPPRYTPANLPPFKRFEAIETKLEKLEQQVYEPTDMINPLLPLIAQLLKMRLGTTQEAVREMATPILDQMIVERATQNRDAMAQALAHLIPDAISQEIQANPRRVAKAIGPEVGDAIREQIRLERDAISESLGPTIGRAIKAQIAVERDSMVDALYPVIGSTVSRYMGEVLNTINDKVESTLSFDGISRKIRARVQGVSEAELILRESMPTTVQALFLIHKTSGLTIAEVQPHLEQRLESNMIAGMLTAIRSFVNDCIAQTGEITELNEIEYGDSRILLEVAGYCYLAVVAKGQIPKPFLERLRKVFGQITQSHGRYIEDFEGDMDTVPPDITLTLKKLGDEQNRLAYEQANQSKSPKTLLILLGLIAAAILLPLLYFQIRGFFDNRLSRKIETALAQELDPVAYDDIQSIVRGREVQLEGRVPSATVQARAAEIAQAIAPKKAISNDIQVVKTPLDPTEAATSLQVITNILNREPKIDIQTEYGPEAITVSGIYQGAEARETIQQAFDTLAGMPPANYQGLLPQLLQERIYFGTGATTIAPAELNRKVKPLAQFLTRNPTVQLELIGHTDPRGAEANNQALAAARAQAIRQALLQAGVEPKQLTVTGSIESPPGIEAGQPLWLYRCVRFEVMSDSP